MGAQEGNQFWKARSSHGRKPKFADEDVLWDACCEYFTWVEENPLWESKVVQRNGEPVDHPLSKMRAMTISGMCVFLDITEDTWDNYRKRDGFLGVTKKVDAIIRDQKFSGAAAGLLNPNIIARDLGLSDKQETKHDVSDRLSDLLEEIDGQSTGLPSDNS